MAAAAQAKVSIFGRMACERCEVTGYYQRKLSARCERCSGVSDLMERIFLATSFLSAKPQPLTVSACAQEGRRTIEDIRENIVAKVPHRALPSALLSALPCSIHACLTLRPASHSSFDAAAAAAAALALPPSMLRAAPAHACAHSLQWPVAFWAGNCFWPVANFVNFRFLGPPSTTPHLEYSPSSPSSSPSYRLPRRS